MRIRSAIPRDYATFVRLFPLLEVDDPIHDSPRWQAELMPGTLIAEDAEGRAVAYAYVRLLGTLAHVCHLVVAQPAQRAGVGRRLMAEVAERAKAAGAERWCLNVKPDNAPAIALYARCGLSPVHHTQALRIAWQAVDATSEGFAVDRVAPEDDAAIERALGFTTGCFADARKKVGRVLVRIARDGEVLGAAVFDPAFPGAHPLRVAHPEIILPLVAALRPYARPSDPHVHVVVEGQPAAAARLVAAGAEVRHNIVHMSAPL